MGVKSLYFAARNFAARNPDKSLCWKIYIYLFQLFYLSTRHLLSVGRKIHKQLIFPQDT